MNQLSRKWDHAFGTRRVNIVVLLAYHYMDYLNCCIIKRFALWPLNHNSEQEIIVDSIFIPNQDQDNDGIGFPI